MTQFFLIVPPGFSFQVPSGLTVKVNRITEQTISGTGEPDAQVWIYRSGSPKGDFPNELKKLIGTPPPSLTVLRRPTPRCQTP
jgi:hypothetical protein